MDAERSRAVTRDEPTPPSGGDQSSPPRRFSSAGDRLQATLAAADVAAEEILDAARAEARELIERAEQVATDRTAQLQTQADILLTRANDLTRQAEALGEATRELTSSVNRVISIEAPAVTELELPAGEAGQDTAPQLESPEQPSPHAEPDPLMAELGTLTETPGAPAPTPAPEPAAEQPPAPQSPEPAASAPEAPAAPAPFAAEAPDEAEVAPEGPPETAPAETEAAPEPPAATQPPAPEPPAAPPRSGSLPPPIPPKPQEKPAELDESPAAPEEPPKKRRSLFSRLKRGADEQELGQPQAQAQRPRASAEAIAEVSPGHQMLARQMLLDGLPEEDVERRLREEFRVRDPGAVLDSLHPSAPLNSPTIAEGTNEQREP